MTFTCALALLAASTSQPAVASQPTLEKLVVLPIELAEGVSQSTGELLNEVFLTELSQRLPPELPVLSSSDVQAMLGNEMERQRMGCSDTTCLVEIGSALGASHLISQHLGKLAGKFIVNTKVISVRDSKVELRRVLYVEATEQGLLDGVRQMARDVASWQRGVPIADAPPDDASKNDRGQRAGADAPEDEGGWLPIAGIGLAGLGVIGATGTLAAAAFFNEKAGDVEQPINDQRGAASWGLGMLGGTALASGAIAAGVVLAVMSWPEAEAE